MFARRAAGSSEKFIMFQFKDTKRLASDLFQDNHYFSKKAPKNVNEAAYATFSAEVAVLFCKASGHVSQLADTETGYVDHCRYMDCSKYIIFTINIRNKKLDGLIALEATKISTCTTKDRLYGEEMEET
ncbi:hypothetical protein TELCIR_05201 [Teladorsagia circumcincta]|uniref:Uncharacterized protein n=1 Tax=Teladorsagia circumcincta TaxID=45464 RepID=A0A2G9URG5_TELCI|nr:hypothetical protein TELCIR_05201 [Teladorsagia circumcincta]